MLNTRGSFSKQYPDRIVNNIYFDSPALSCYTDNLAGLSERSKLRWRFYGNLYGVIATSALEIKRRHHRYCEKLVQPVSFPIDMANSWRDICGSLQIRIDSVFYHAFRLCPEPAIVNRYLREYYEDFNRHVRLTIDRDLEYFPINFTSKPYYGRSIYLMPFQIVEIKTSIAFESEIGQILRDLPFQVTKSSKYAMGVQALAI